MLRSNNTDFISSLCNSAKVNNTNLRHLTNIFPHQFLIIIQIPSWIQFNISVSGLAFKMHSFSDTNKTKNAVCPTLKLSFNRPH